MEVVEQEMKFRLLGCWTRSKDQTKKTEWLQFDIIKILTSKSNLGSTKRDKTENNVHCRNRTRDNMNKYNNGNPS